MKASIEVSSRSEAAAVQSAMDDPPTRALVLVMGALVPLPEKTRKRVLETALANLAERDEA